MLIEPNPTNVCFGCGGGNARGMKLTFEQDDAARKIIGRFKLSAEYQGAFGIIHGGVIATVLDEVMGKVCRFRDVRAVTAEMNVQYLSPVWVDSDLVVEGYEKEMTGRNLYLVGEIKDASGKLLARSTGRFVVVDRTRQPKDGAAEQVSST
ncbi:MAG TPA: PaaI family thioesterase [Candidatus Acidoferrales bacterium]